MSLLPEPLLDDRRYDDIVAEARTLIPRYTPEYTNLNDSDPGMTIVQVHAWMTDMLLYRVNRMPRLAYVKFLELIDVHLRPATAARAHLTFTPLVPAPATSLPVARGTRVAADPGDGSAPVIFETDRSLAVLGVPLRQVLVWDGTRYEERTLANEGTAEGYQPFGGNPGRGSALYLGFDAALPFPTMQLSLLGVVPVDPWHPPTTHCDLDDAAIRPPAELVWEGWDGTQWLGVGVDRDESKAFSRTGYVLLSVRGDRLAPLSINGGPARRWIRVRVAVPGYERPPKLVGLWLNTVPATAATTVEREVLGGGTGRPGLQLRLARTPVLPGSLILEVDEGHGPVAWHEAGDLLAAGPDDTVFTLDQATGVVTFSVDGLHGRPPLPNPDNPRGNIVARSYRAGGGVEGNLPVGAVAQLQSPVDGIASVGNLLPAEGGAAAETIDAAMLRAPEELRTRDRAVTAADFEFLAEATPGVRVRRAIALARTHPAFPGVQVPGSVTVIIVPHSDSPRPQPSEATVRTVCAHLDMHRLLGSEIHVTGPRYRKVRVRTRLTVREDADLGAARRSVEAALTAFFHPLTGGADGTGWPLGGTIHFSLVYRAVLVADPGIAVVEEVVIVVDDEDQPVCTDVPIGPLELLYSDGHDVTTGYA
ncbi:putative baseplate assembly protein [Mycolicibacterium sp. CR10]|uniref:putative baseplate assembly protein n=1 Tax=Mycolicibacterium sp. CR10 TaxID=2562314 RepID=UPI0010BF8545|nr:putative baseplate assembly protein [Mycolicibacterium sp. CR10]